MKTNDTHIGNDVFATCAHSAKLEHNFQFLYKYNLQRNNTNKNMESVPHNVRHKIINNSLMFIELIF
jgi:hypothetical protein